MGKGNELLPDGYNQQSMSTYQRQLQLKHIPLCDQQQLGSWQATYLKVITIALTQGPAALPLISCRSYLLRARTITAATRSSRTVASKNSMPESSVRTSA